MAKKVVETPFNKHYNKINLTKHYIKLFLLFSFSIIQLSLFSQINNEIRGVWIKTDVLTFDGKSNLKTRNLEKQYTKLIFENENDLRISFHYTHYGNLFKYNVYNNILKYGLKEFLITKIDSVNLFLTELIGGKLTKESIKYIYTKEKIYLRNIPLNKNDIILNNNDTLFIESEKIFSQFIDPYYSNDFNVYIANYLDGYSTKNHYSLATFIINKNGIINNIRIISHINKSFDKKLIKAIKKTQGKWKIPILHGKKISVVKYVECKDIYINNWNNVNYDFLNKQKWISSSSYFMDNLKKLAYCQLGNNSSKSIEYINKCNSISPNNPNVYFLKYQYFKNNTNQDSILFYQSLLKKTKLKYLLK